MANILPIIFLILGCLALWLLYLNRSSTKIHEATVILAVTILGALAIVLKGEPIKKTIHSVYFVNAQENRLSFFDLPVLNNHEMFRRMIFSTYKEEMERNNKPISFDFNKTYQSIVDLQAIEILHHLCLYYGNQWYTDRFTKTLPGLILFGGKQIEPDTNKDDIVIIPLTNLPKSIQEAPFFSAKLGLETIGLPKGTTVEYTRNPNNNVCELRLSKPLHFDIRIKMYLNAGTLGLGEVGHYAGLTSFEDKVVDSKAVGSNYTAVVRIDCIAKFGFWMKWNPDVIRYKTWSQKLFDDLYETFDWSPVGRQMTEYQRNLAVEKINRLQNKTKSP
jgi:hypothetical protein